MLYSKPYEQTNFYADCPNCGEQIDVTWNVNRFVKEMTPIICADCNCEFMLED